MCGKTSWRIDLCSSGFKALVLLHSAQQRSCAQHEVCASVRQSASKSRSYPRMWRRLDGVHEAQLGAGGGALGQAVPRGPCARQQSQPKRQRQRRRPQQLHQQQHITSCLSEGKTSVLQMQIPSSDDVWHHISISSRDLSGAVQHVGTVQHGM